MSIYNPSVHLWGDKRQRQENLQKFKSQQDLLMQRDSPYTRNTTSNKLEMLDPTSTWVPDIHTSSLSSPPTHTPPPLPPLKTPLMRDAAVTQVTQCSCRLGQLSMNSWLSQGIKTSVMSSLLTLNLVRKPCKQPRSVHPHSSLSCRVEGKGTNDKVPRCPSSLRQSKHLNLLHCSLHKTFLTVVTTPCCQNLEKMPRAFALQLGWTGNCSAKLD